MYAAQEMAKEVKMGLSLQNIPLQIISRSRLDGQWRKNDEFPILEEAHFIY